MAKNFGKILLGLTAAGAAGAGAYYWLKNRHNEEPEDEFDDTFEDDDFELDDDLGEVPERGYTTLTPSSAKEETSEESEEKTDDAEAGPEAASQTPETDSEESDPGTCGRKYASDHCLCPDHRHYPGKARRAGRGGFQLFRPVQ